MKCRRCRVTLKTQEEVTAYTHAFTGEIGGRKVEKITYCPKCKQFYKKKTIEDSFPKGGLAIGDLEISEEEYLDAMED